MNSKIFLKGIGILCLLFILFHSCTKQNEEIKPYAENPRYWQYKRRPVLLLGGSKDDNLFQIDSLEQHLDEMKAAGGNFVRNTMSSRDNGNLWPFKKLENGMYDLCQWNEQYWQKFENFLKLTSERDIIVQIEVWDRFDYTRDPWLANPMNPKNNLNYTPEESGMNEIYPNHPGADLQPFFHIVEGMKWYNPKLKIVEQYQQKLVDKILSYTFQYRNVLYCIDNETNTEAEWGNYWINYIRGKAIEKEINIYITDMYEEFHSFKRCQKCRELVANPQFYTFMDISQINNRVFNEDHWKSLCLIISEREKFDLRPANCTKVYGGGNYSWGSGTNRDGVERFCRNVMGGCAAVRHHRPPYGNGLNEKAKASIKAIRKVETQVSVWNLILRMDLLENSEEDEAYLMAGENTYLLYFPEGGDVNVRLTEQNDSRLNIKWINVDSGNWGKVEKLEGKGKISVSAPNNNGWFAVIKKGIR